MKHTWVVIGGEITEPKSGFIREESDIFYKDNAALTFVGFYHDYNKAHEAWKAYSWMNVDNALMCFNIIPLNVFLMDTTK